MQRSVSELFGEPTAEALVEVAGPPRGGVAVAGWAVLPPHGHANCGRQYVYANGRPVRAGPLCKLVDGLFAQLYKSSARLAHDSSAGELLR